MPKGVFHCNLAFFTTTRQRETGHEAIDRITLPKEGNRVVVMTEGGLEEIAARFPVKTVIVTCQIGGQGLYSLGEFRAIFLQVQAVGRCDC